YLNGHSDVIAGVLVGAREDERWARMRQNRAQLGTVLGTFEAWLLLRGLRTLFPRVEAASRSALPPAERLSRHPAPRAELDPGLPGPPTHAVGLKQRRGGFGGMLSIRVTGGVAHAIATAARVRVWKRATSLGGVESLIEHRASIEGPDSPVPPDLLRLSVGIEDVGDLIADLKSALGG